jgi:CRP-like cAMP-binding protein
MSIHFLNKGQVLFYMGEVATNIFIVFNGKAVRKVTV